MALAIVGTDAELDDYQAAIAKAEGLPRRGVVVGGPDYLPQTYSPGAAGWTDRVANTIDTDTNQRALIVAPEYRKHLGKTVRVNAKDVVIPGNGALVDVTRKPEAVVAEAAEAKV